MTRPSSNSLQPSHSTDCKRPFAVFRRWSGADDLYLRQRFTPGAESEIAAHLGRSVKACEQRFYKLTGTTLARDAKPGRTKGRRLKTRTT